MSVSCNLTIVDVSILYSDVPIKKSIAYQDMFVIVPNHVGFNVLRIWKEITFSIALEP